MSAPFAESIVGSWLCVRTNHTPQSRFIGHFTNEGTSHSEVDHENRRDLFTSPRYEIHGDTLSLIFKSGSTMNLKLTQEDDNTVEWWDEARNRKWWMKRLIAPAPYSLAFVSASGALESLNGK